MPDILHGIADTPVKQHIHIAEECDQCIEYHALRLVVDEGVTLREFGLAHLGDGDAD
jgi:hypothetical protein